MAERQLIQLGLLAANEPGSIAIGPFGSRMKAELYVATGVPIIRGTNISSGSSWKGDWVYVPEAFAAEMPNCLTRPGDLVFPHRGSIGEVALVPDDGITYMISTSLMKFRPDTRRVSPEFLLHFFRSSKGRAEILRFASQVGTPGIGQPLTSLRQFQVDLPPLPIQRAIAATLGSLNDKIELNRRMNETLEAMARAIFQDWFVTFGPTRAKMEGRPPYLAPDLWSLFPDRLDAEGKPEEWDMGPLSSLMEIISGGTPPTADSSFWNGQIPWYSVVDAPSDTDLFVFDTQRKLTSHGLRRSPGCLIPANTVIVSARGTVGKLAIAGAEMTFNQSCYGLKPVRGFGGWGLFFAIKNAVSRFHDLAHGAVFDTITKATFDAIQSVSPPVNVARAFEEIADPLMLRIKANVAEARTLTATRDLLLPRLMSGELRVKDAERIIETAA